MGATRPRTTPTTPTTSASTDVVRVRIDLAYDGGGFAGFARQPDRRTVQGVVEDALSRLCGGPVTTTGAGRTDAGVHATAQVVHADVPAEARLLADLRRARESLDKLCGPEVTVWQVRRVPHSFDARFSATQRRYRYRLCDGAALDPLRRQDTWHAGGPALDVGAMAAGGQQVLGEHDFSAFCRRAGDEHLVRRVDRLEVHRDAVDLVVIEVAGKAFCHQMVRSLVGTLVEVGRGKHGPEWVVEVLAAGDRQAAGPVAPPHGLTLVGVAYG
ncbi:MAG: tRNA pseudouridine(38-40) synthase TruA [Egibacteraceae bacterium]